MTKQPKPMLTKKGEALKRLMKEIEIANPKERETGLLSANVPVSVLRTVDRMAKHLGCTRTDAVIKLLDVGLCELGAEGTLEVQKLFGRKKSGDGAGKVVR